MTSAEYKQLLARALRELDTFSVPEVGTFMAEHIPAKIDTESGKLLPPQTRVRIEASTRHLKPLFDLLTEKYGLKRDQAETTAADVGRYVIESLKVGALELPGVGKLFRGPKGLVLEAGEVDPTLATYGLAPTAYAGLLPGKELPTPESVAPAPKTKGGKAGAKAATATDKATTSKAAVKESAKKTSKPPAKAGKGKKQLSPGEQLKQQLEARAKAEGRELTTRELAELEVAMELEGQDETVEEKSTARSELIRFTSIVLLIVGLITAGLIYVFRDFLLAPPPPPAIPEYQKTALHTHDSLSNVAADSARRDSLARTLSTRLGADTTRQRRARVDSLAAEAEELSAESNDPPNATYKVFAGGYETDTDAQNQAVRFRGRAGYKPQVIKGGRAGGRFKLLVYTGKNGAEARKRLAEIKTQGYPDAYLQVEAPK